MLRSTFLLAGFVLTLSASADGAIIGGPAAFGPGTGGLLAPGVNAHLVSSAVATPSPGVTGAGAVGNTLMATLDVYSMDFGEEFNIIFPVIDGAGMEGTTEYSVALTLVNMLGANGDDPGDAGKEINGLNIDLMPGPFALTGFDPTPAPGIAPPLSTYPLQFGGIAGTTLQWGGDFGGGGGVPFGTSQTFTFNVLVLDPTGAADNRSGTLGIEVVANPEPTTMMLGGLALIPGAIAVRRRRRQKQAEAADEETTA